MEKNTISYYLEEYKALRNEIMFLEKSIGQFFLAAIIADISLISAIGSIFFKLKIEAFSIVGAYFFLFPPLILISVLYIISSHRKDIHRIGTYIQVFYEENIFAKGWESRLSKFRDINKGESLDYIPLVFFVIFLISIIIFMFILYYEEICIWYKLLHFFLPALEGFFLYKGYRNFCSSSIPIRNKYYEDWKSIRQG